jgi:crooked neck
MPRSKSVNLHKAYTTFEKQFGDQEGVEDVVLAKRRVQYEDELKQNPKNYDSWIDLARLEETGGDWDKVRDVYERAIAQIPPSHEKRHWRRYLYIWLFYTTFEEITTRDMDRVDAIYKAALGLIPHTKWTSAKVWLNYAYFQIRQMNIAGARKILGQALGRCPKRKLFREYIELEIKFFEFDRVRMLHEKHVLWNSENTQAWKEFAELERGLEDVDRARAIYETALEQDVLDMPDMLWKEYIEYEVENEDYDRARDLYERLLQRSAHHKVWTSYAAFEVTTAEGVDEDDEENEEVEEISEEAKARARKIYERGYKHLKEQDDKNGRVQVLNAWKAFETEYGSPGDLAKVQKLMPSKVKKRRKLDDDSYEEYMDWLFPADDEREAKLAMMLQKAQQWKLKQQQQQQSAEE